MLTEAIIYSQHYDGQVRSTIRAGQGVDDFLSFENVKDDWTALKAMVSSPSASASSAMDAEDDAVVDRRLSPCIGVVLPAESAAALSKLN